MYLSGRNQQRIEMLQAMNIGSSIGLSAASAYAMHLQVPPLSTARRLTTSSMFSKLHNYRASRGNRK